MALFAHAYLLEYGTACHNLVFPVHGQNSGTLSSKPGRAACRLPRVTRACAVCKAMLFSQEKKKQAAGPNSLGATLSLRARIRAPASVFLFLFFFPFVFCFSFLPLVF